METEIAIENKTIILSYDDVSRMKDFCCDENGVSRDFMDWYINDNAFFSKSGILIIDYPIRDELSSKEAINRKFVIAFNYKNPSFPQFALYDYMTQKLTCEYSFNREANLSMDKISVNIKTISEDKQFGLLGESMLFVPKNTLSEIKKDLAMRMRILKKSPRSMKSPKNINKKEIAIGTKKAYSSMAEQGVYFCYAMMYYFAKNKAKEITGAPKDQAINDGVGKQITAIYKYSGYVNINEAKIYKAVIKKDKNEPVREYGRHIERWSVRGHYRRVGDKTIWIEPFEKGDGELEKRIYGTEKESEVKIIPKVFEVTRTVFDKKASDNATVDVVPNVKVAKSEPVKKEMDIRKEPTFVENIRKIWENFKSKFKSKKQ